MSHSSRFLKYLQELSIATPTKIQDLCFEPIFEGKSVFGLAPTGSGKTLAFVLPLMLAMDCETRDIQQLILVPTRELGTQIAKVCQQVSNVISSLDKKNVLVRCAFGGTPIAKQIEEISKKPHVLIATPGRMIDLLERKAINLKKLKTLVMDEADIMVGMGFAEQIEIIFNSLPNNIQVGLFSATQNEKVSLLEEAILKEKDHLIFNVNAQEEDKKLHDSPIEHKYIVSSSENKFTSLVQFLKHSQEKNSGKMIVFCHQKDTVQALTNFLKKEGFLADSLTGDLGQVQRNSIFRNFKTGNLKYLIATNIASRGLDIDKLSAVIHYDVPFNQEDYIHRSGRTGRSGFSEGSAVTLCDYRTKSIYLKLMEELHLSPQEIQLSKISKPIAKEAKALKLNATPHKVTFIKVHINKGKQDKIRPGDILGAFIQEMSLEKEDVGSIYIFNNFTHIEINAAKKHIIVNKSFKVKNLSVKVVLAKAD